ncbi:MAG: discoidin domain-containing protein [Clostridia bacterium]|nr:discoidin domain-containing protein [Clostridia bacterium]
MKKGKGIFKRSVLLIMAFSIAFGISCAAVMGASASETPVSTFDDGYQLNANWIWADTEPSEGQWISLRKTFTLDSVPSEFIARISADTKYWLWINGDLAVFEGQLKLGDSRYTWYYDKIDLKDYLTEGENTIAVQVFYSGKTSASTINTRVPSFLFDAVGEGYSLVSDASWKATLDPAYEEPISLNNERNGEANIKYNAAKEMIDSAGNKWTDKAFDDSAWANAVIQDEKIRTNRIYDDSGNVSGVYYQDTDPRTKLVLRSIPAIKVDELKKYTADDWTVSEEGYVFAPLSLPDTYTVEAEIIVAEPSTSYSGGGGSADAAIGLCVCVADAENFYMPQIGFAQPSKKFDGLRFKPHKRLSGAWSTTTNDLTSTEVGKSVYLSGSYDYRYNTKHTVKIEVTADAINTYFNGYLVGTIECTELAREGSTIGFRQDRNELINLYSLKVTDTSGTELYNAGIENLESGDSASRISLLAQENASVTTAYNTVSVDANGKSYIAIRNCRAAINDGKFYDTYVITNETNIQGTPYIKVKSATGGELISMVSDSWNKGTSSSIAHQYITKAGEQSWEALGWMNGYKITFTVPKGVEVLELGFRRSGYDTEATGSVTTDSETLNKLYKEAYDTLIVCMRDSYMDCPDRERTQWLGDAVINMQQAAYALDDNAALLYKKTLTQAIGFVQKNGAIPSKIALGRPDLELPMQSLAGVHSFWQYYMYYGDKELVTESYPVLLNYLKLWDVSDSGVITHRDGNWNWYDWGSHPDTVIIENCWYYEALKAVLNIAKLEGSGASAEDIELLEGRMTKIENSFDTLYWNEERNAYYNETDNTLADDRANAMAIYTGLADPTRYEGVLNVLKNTYNSGPYMEKYVLEAMYMMGADDEALARTLERFSPLLEDGYPTLPEIWLNQTLYGGDETKNHAWTGAPISMLYMYNAGIAPISPAFESIRIRPQLGSLTSLSAAVERASGRIELSVSRSDNEVVLAVTVPRGVSEALIYVPRLENDTKILLGSSVIYAGGAQIGANMPTNIYYEAEDTDFIAFSVPSGTYTFKAIENTASEGESNNVTFNATEGGSLTVNGSSAGSAWSAPVLSGESISVTAAPSEGYRLVAITGSIPESITTSSAVTRTYTPAADMNITFIFEKEPVKNNLLSITADDTEMAGYAVSVFVDGTLVSLPFTGSYAQGREIKISAIPTSADNYSVSIGGADEAEITVIMNDRVDVSISVKEKDTVNKKTVSSVTSNKSSANNDTWYIDNLKDGKRISSGASLGYSTGYVTNPDISASPCVITFDLGVAETINQISLFPRTDSWAQDSSLSSNFPTDFTVSVSSDGSVYKTVLTVTDADNPRFKQQCYSFEETSARYVKLTVTKLGIPAYNDGQSNDHYRLQLAEAEIAYVGEITEPEPIKTEYGDIPFAYKDHPVAVFDMNNGFLGAYETYAAAVDSVGIIAKSTNTGKGVDSIILIRKNITHNTNLGDGNSHSFYNDVIIDLGGNTVTLDGKNFLSLYVYSNTSSVTYGTVTVKNGTFINKTATTAPICFSGGKNVAAPVNYKVNVENVKFTAPGAEKLYAVARTWAPACTSYLKLDLELTDCIFDYSGAHKDSVMLGMCYNSDAGTRFNVKINGGSIVCDSYSRILEESDGNDSLVFSTDEEGKYTTLRAPLGASLSNMTVNGGDLTFVKSGVDGESVLYKLVPSSLIESFDPKTSISLESDLVLNVYVPARSTLKSIMLEGDPVNIDAITPNDEGYYVIKRHLKSFEAAKTLLLTVTLKDGGDELMGSFGLSVPDYAETVINGEYSEKEKTLAKDMLAYVRSAYTYFNEAENKDEAYSRIDEIIGSYEREFSASVSTADIGEGLRAATFILDSTPTVRLYLTGSAEDYTFNRAVAESGETLYKGEVCEYVDISVYAYQMIENITYKTSDGKSGSYNIITYYDYAVSDEYVGEDKQNLVDLIEKFYNYCRSASEYRQYVISEKAE